MRFQCRRAADLLHLTHLNSYICKTWYRRFGVLLCWASKHLWLMKCSNRNKKPLSSVWLFSSNCWTLSAFTSSVTKLLWCNEKRGEGWGGGWGGGLRDTTSTSAACINHRANKLKAKWLLALYIYHEGKPNEALYTLEDRGMLLFITVICGWLSWLSALEITVKLFGLLLTDSSRVMLMIKGISVF